MIAHEHTDEQFLRLNLAAIDWEPDGTIGVLEITIHTICCDVHPRANVTMTEEAIVLFV
tara:strand:+ start:247 stop:423 length:177 start_codon:yes stop_codon:yes gene_type:complete